MSDAMVSVVTPTWDRPEMMLETVRHVREQEYRPMEHVVVSDGPDEDEVLEMEITADQAEHLNTTWPPFNRVPVRYHELGRNWSGLMRESFGIAPLLAGYLLARGEYIMPWCDDERALVPDHVSRLVDLLESTGADFVYPRVRIWRAGDPTGPETTVIGTDPPERNHITHYLFRASCLWRFGMPRWGSHPVDWELIYDWMQHGATGAMLPDVTFDHRLDQI